MARCLLQAKDLPMKFQAKFISCANYQLNWILMRIVCHVTLVDKWCDKKPFVIHLGTFGCVSWVQISNDYRKKLDGKSHACIMMGQFEESKSYRLFDPVKYKIIIKRNVIFDEKTYGLGLLNSYSSSSYIDPFGIVKDTESIVPPRSILTSSSTSILESTGS